MRGATFFWQVADGGTAYIWQVGATFFGSADFLKAPHTFGKFPMGGPLIFGTSSRRYMYLNDLNAINYVSNMITC